MAMFTRGFLWRAGFTESELLQMRADVKGKLLTSGPESIMSWSSNGETVSKRPEMSVAEWMEEISYSLALTRPDLYADRIAPDETTAVFPNRFA